MGCVYIHTHTYIIFYIYYFIYMYIYNFPRGGWEKREREWSDACNVSSGIPHCWGANSRLLLSVLYFAALLWAREDRQKLSETDKSREFISKQPPKEEREAGGRWPQSTSSCPGRITQSSIRTQTRGCSSPCRHGLWVCARLPGCHGGTVPHSQSSCGLKGTKSV